MKISKIGLILFEKMPEWRIKNNLRYFLAFSRLIPDSISDFSPIKGYELHRKLKRGDIVVDAGAYPGDYAVYASRKIGKEGKIICFEPDAKNARILRKNLRAEGKNNFIIVPKGLWNKNTKLNVQQSDGLHSSLSAGNSSSDEVDVVKLDDELKKLGIKKVNVVKMDIEGAEIKAVQGCKGIIRKCKPYFTIASYHIVNGEVTARFLDNFFKKLGYKVKVGFPKHLTIYASKKNEFLHRQ